MCCSFKTRNLCMCVENYQELQYLPLHGYKEKNAELYKALISKSSQRIEE